MIEQPVRFVDRASMRLDSAAARTVGIAARRMDKLRTTAYAEYPEGEHMRDRARQIRLQTLARLDHHLDEFAAALEAAGGQVHWAADAAEANAMVTSIATAGDATRVVKSKSMVTEEIELNESLEHHGIEEHWQDPHTTHELKRGDCEDYALYAWHVLRRNGHETHILAVFAGDEGHAVCVVREDGHYHTVCNEGLKRLRLRPHGKKMEKKRRRQSADESKGSHSGFPSAVRRPSPP